MQHINREDLLLLTCQLQIKPRRCPGEDEVQFIAFPEGKDEVFQQVGEVGLLEKRMVPIGNGDYLFRITSPGAKVIGGEFTITKDGVLNECHKNGYLAHTCRLEDVITLDEIAFDLEYSQRVRFSLNRPLTALERALKDLEKHGVGELQKPTDKSKPSEKRKDSGYSGSGRPSEELQAPPQPVTPPRSGQDCESDHAGSPVSTSSSDDGRDIYSSDLAHGQVQN